jgi:subtilisin family serine protease
MFWSSGSVSLELTRDELVQLPLRMPMIAGVYPNREVRLPPVSRSSDTRPAINDYRGYTWGISRTGALACWGAYDAEGMSGNKRILVAVLDTGIDPQHPDFTDEKGQSKIAGYGI